MKIRCPIIDKDIDEYDCFETGTVAERYVKVNAPVGIKEIKESEDFHKRCMECPNHKN
ncbi:hypothetical protein [Selenomonas sp.]|uniref:hypothetical protein n=1 Tax=Selenomonas sp. TaxID=2053611 RepID=UPI0025EEBE2D|nr:hypothetical protein [Selenomonas sp.]